MSEMMVVQQHDRFIAPVVDIQSALHRYQAFKDFVSGVLRTEVDYGTIPGTNKPTLLKPGAEKLATFFGLSPHFQTVKTVEDWTGADHGGEPFFYFHYRCQMTRGDQVVAEGEGSANSWEKKYRYRNGERVCPKCGKATIIKGKQEYGGGWLCFAKKGGCGAKFPELAPEIVSQDVGQIKNPDIADVVNTLQKMAQKRAYVAAVLLAVNGSEYFTQDVEDYLDASYTEAPAASTPATSAPSASAKPNGGSGKYDVPDPSMPPEFDPYYANQKPATTPPPAQVAQPPAQAARPPAQAANSTAQPPANGAKSKPTDKATPAMYDRYSEIYREAKGLGLDVAVLQPGLTVQQITDAANLVKGQIGTEKAKQAGGAK